MGNQEARLASTRQIEVIRGQAHRLVWHIDRPKLFRPLGFLPLPELILAPAAVPVDDDRLSTNPATGTRRIPSFNILIGSHLVGRSLLPTRARQIDIYRDCISEGTPSASEAPVSPELVEGVTSRRYAYIPNLHGLQDPESIQELTAQTAGLVICALSLCVRNGGTRLAVNQTA